MHRRVTMRRQVTIRPQITRTIRRQVTLMFPSGIDRTISMDRDTGVEELITLGATGTGDTITDTVLGYTDSTTPRDSNGAP